MIENTAIIITTFMRDKSLLTCVESVRDFYPDIPIYVGDNGEESEEKTKFLKRYDCIHIKMPYDSGVCAARNEAMRRIPHNVRYVVVLEDDVIFNDKTRLENWGIILRKRANMGIIGAPLKKYFGSKNRLQRYEAKMWVERDMLHIQRVDSPHYYNAEGLKYFYCDIVANVFMMRRKVWDTVKWDEQYKTTPEHTDFFLSLKLNSDWKVAFTDSTMMDHAPTITDSNYMAMRSRRVGYAALGRKWNLRFYRNSWNISWGLQNPLPLFSFEEQGVEDVVIKPEAKKVVHVPKKDTVAIGIKTFFREKNLFRTIESIEKHFPYPYHLYIADDSGDISDEKEYRYYNLTQKGHSIIKLSFDTGLSSGRNAIVKDVREKFVLMIDDDLILVDKESIKNMMAVLKADKEIGLVSAIVENEGGGFYGGNGYRKGIDLEIREEVLYKHRPKLERRKANGVDYHTADQVANFFLARTEVFKEVMWDNRIKIEYEHMDFFLRLKETKWKAAVCMGAKAVHAKSEIDHSYTRFRRNAPYAYFYGKHGIRNIITKYQ